MISDPWPEEAWCGKHARNWRCTDCDKAGVRCEIAMSTMPLTLDFIMALAKGEQDWVEVKWV